MRVVVAPMPSTHQDKQLGVIKHILTDLYKQQDLLGGNDAWTLAKIATLKEQEKTVMLKLRALNRPLEYDLIEANRAMYVRIQNTHARNLERKGMAQVPGGIAVYEINDSNDEELVGDKAFEREYFHTRLLDGSLLLVDTRSALLAVLCKFCRYSPDRTVETNENNCTRMKYMLEHGNEPFGAASILETAMGAVFISITNCIASSNYHGFKGLPETLIFDTKPLSIMQQNFQTQLLVVTTIHILRAFSASTDRGSTKIHEIVTFVAGYIVAGDRRFNDVEELANLAYDQFNSNSTSAEGAREMILNALTIGFAEGSEPRRKAQTALRAILDEAREYNDTTFNAVPSTVRTFRRLGIPIEASCIAPLLHKQGRTVRTMMKLHSDTYAQVYFPILNDSLIALLYEFPSNV